MFVQCYPVYRYEILFLFFSFLALILSLCLFVCLSSSYFLLFLVHYHWLTGYWIERISGAYARTDAGYREGSDIRQDIWPIVHMVIVSSVLPCQPIWSPVASSLIQVMRKSILIYNKYFGIVKKWIINLRSENFSLWHYFHV